jgi:hypothetical protein
MMTERAVRLGLCIEADVEEPAALTVDRALSKKLLLKVTGITRRDSRELTRIGIDRHTER